MSRLIAVVGALRLVSCAGSLLLLLLPVSIASAQDHRYSDYFFGEQALGLAGAVAATGSDPSAAYYNPGGLAFVDSDLFYGSVNFWARDSIVYKNALKTSLDPSKGSSISTTNNGFLPTSGAIVKQIGDNQLFVFGTFVPVHRKQVIDRDMFSLGPNSQLVSTSLNVVESEDLVLVGPSYAIRLFDNWGLGVSAFYAKHNYTRSTGTTSHSVTGDPGDSVFVATELTQVLYNTDISTHGLHLRLGTAWRPNWGLRVGLAVASEIIPFVGSARLSHRGAYFQDGTMKAKNSSAKVDAKAMLPWSIRAGLGYEKPGSWAVMADVSHHFAYRGAYFNAPKAMGADRLDLAVKRVVALDSVTNFAFGVEWFIIPELPFRVGCFSNLSSNPPIPSSLAGRTYSTKIDEYGVTMAIGWLGKRNSISIAATYARGAGHAMGYSFDSYPERVGVTSDRILISVSGATRWAQSQIKKQIRKMKKKSTAETKDGSK